MPTKPSVTPSRPTPSTPTYRETPTFRDTPTPSTPTYRDVPTRDAPTTRDRDGFAPKSPSVSPPTRTPEPRSPTFGTPSFGGGTTRTPIRGFGEPLSKPSIPTPTAPSRSDPTVKPTPNSNGYDTRTPTYPSTGSSRDGRGAFDQGKSPRTTTPSASSPRSSPRSSLGDSKLFPVTPRGGDSRSTGARVPSPSPTPSIVPGAGRDDSRTRTPSVGNTPSTDLGARTGTDGRTASTPRGSPQATPQAAEGTQPGIKSQIASDQGRGSRLNSPASSGAGTSAADPKVVRDGYGGAQSSYYYDGDDYWVGYDDGFKDGFDHGYDEGHYDGHAHENWRHHWNHDYWSDYYHHNHLHHHYDHHDNWSFYFHWAPYYAYSNYGWYDHWYDSGWSWWNGFSLTYFDDDFGLFFRVGSGGQRYYHGTRAFFYRYPSHHCAPTYISSYADLGYSYGYYSYVPRFGHFGFWDYYPRTTVIYETYIPTQTYVERPAASPEVDGEMVNDLVMRAEAEFAAQRYDQAIALLEQAVTAAPEASQLHFALALVRGAQGQYDVAADSLRRGVELSEAGDPLVPDLRTLYGDDQVLAQHLARMADAVRANPNDVDVRLVEAYFLLGSDRAQASKAALDTLGARLPQDRIVARLSAAATERVNLGLTGGEPTVTTPAGGTTVSPPPAARSFPGNPAYQGEGTTPNQPTTPGQQPDSASPPSREYTPPPPRWF